MPTPGHAAARPLAPGSTGPPAVEVRCALFPSPLPRRPRAAALCAAPLCPLWLAGGRVSSLPQPRRTLLRGHACSWRCGPSRWVRLGGHAQLGWWSGPGVHQGEHRPCVCTHGHAACGIPEGACPLSWRRGCPVLMLWLSQLLRAHSYHNHIPTRRCLTGRSPPPRRTAPYRPSPCMRRLAGGVRQGPGHRHQRGPRPQGIRHWWVAQGGHGAPGAAGEGPWQQGAAVQ